MRSRRARISTLPRVEGIHPPLANAGPGGVVPATRLHDRRTVRSWPSLASGIFVLEDIPCKVS